jgi:hypothetical protein
MAGNINEPKSHDLSAWTLQFEVRESKIDGNSAPLFFLQSVGIDACKRFHERGFTVVDVSGSADDDGFHSDLNEKPNVLSPFLQSRPNFLQ